MDEKIKLLFSVLCGSIATFMKQYGLLIILVLLAIVFDFATGLIKAKVTDEGLDSKKGTKGFFKKVALMATLFFGFFLDFFIPIMLSKISFELPFNLPFALTICFYIVINECISICENLYACNPDIMPRWITRILKQAKAKLDLEVEDKNEDIEEE